MKSKSALVLVSSVCSLTLACATGPVPRRLDTQQRDLVAQAHFSARVAVAPFAHPAYSERLIESLRATSLFDAVGRLGEIDDPDLIATVERPISGTAVIPLWTALTLGVVPTIVREEWGEVFSLRSPREGAAPVAIDFSYEGQSTIGWFALLRAPSEQHALKRPSRTHAFRDALALTIVKKQREIDQALALR